MNCGGEPAPEDAIWAQCEACGKTCGYCKGCATIVFSRYIRYATDTGQKLARHFVRQSMDRHEALRCRLPERWVRTRLTRMPKTCPTVELF